MNREILLYRHIGIEEIRTELCITPASPNLIQSWSREVPLWPIRIKVIESTKEHAIVPAGAERTNIRPQTLCRTIGIARRIAGKIIPATRIVE